MNSVPLVYYALASIRLFCNAHPDYGITVALNTDSKELKRLVEKQKYIPNIAYVWRKDSLAGDKVPKVEVIKDTYMELKKSKFFDIIIDLDITSPMRREVDIENVVNIYLSNPEYDLVFSVVKARRSPYFNMVEKRGEYYKKICGSAFTARQEAPASYELNASIYAYRPNFLETDIDKTILDYKCGISIMPDFLVLDIDSEEDFRMMEILYIHFCEEDIGLEEVYEMAKNMKNC